MMAQKSKHSHDPSVPQVLKSWLDQLTKRWIAPPLCQLKSPDLRSTETLLRPHRIPVPMSRVCFSFRRERSALTWANRVMSSANQPSSSHQSNFRSSAAYPSPVWRGPTLPSSSSLIWALSATFSIPKRCGFLPPQRGVSDRSLLEHGASENRSAAQGGVETVERSQPSTEFRSN